MDLLRKYRQDSPAARADFEPPMADEFPSLAGLAGGDDGGGDGGVAAGATTAPWPVFDPIDDLEGPDGDLQPPERLPVPDGLDAPCRACEGQGRGPNPLFWQDRFDAIHCAGCRPCPSRAMFKRFLQLKGVADASTGVVPAGERWLEERELSKNPWLQSGRAASESSTTEPSTTEGY